MTDAKKLPPSAGRNTPDRAVGGVLMDLAFTYMLDRILADELRRQTDGSSDSIGLNFGESILQHTRDAEEWATPAPDDYDD